jgi:hypothetical protein
MTTARPRCNHALLFAFALAVAAPAAAQTQLRWKFSDGQKHLYTITQDMEMSANVGGQKIDTTMSQTIDMTWNVKKVDSDGSARMEQSIDRMRLTVKGPAGEMKFDSKDAAAAPPQLAALKTLTDGMVGQPFELTMTPRGEIKDVKVPQKVLDAGKAAGPVGAFISEEGLKNMTAQGSLAFPENSLSAGDKWDQKRTVNMPGVGKMVLDTTYTFRGPADGSQKVEAGMNLKIEDSPLGLSITSQKSDASFQFDNEKGVLRRSDVTQKMTLGGKVMDQDFSQDITTKTSLKLGDGSSKKG